MKASKTVIVLAILIATLALVAAGAGVFWREGGSPFTFVTVHGEAVTMHGRGLYRFDTLNGAAQEIAGDTVTLCLGIPLLVISIVLYRKGSLRGALLLAGSLAYFLYTYASMSFMSAYNPLFLVYVALFSLSLFAFVLSLMGIPVAELPARFSPRLPRRAIAILLFAVGGFMMMLWLGLIVSGLLNGTLPPELDSYTTLVIQALDLGVLVPVAFLSGVLLLRRRPFGYLLAAVTLIKGLTMLCAVSAMAYGQWRAGVDISPALLVIMPAFALLHIVMTGLLLGNVSERAAASSNTQVSPAAPVPLAEGQG